MSHLATDDRDVLEPGAAVLLVIDDDVNFSRILIELAHARGMRVVTASDGATGLKLAQRFKPSVIALDIRLPDCEGWSILDVLKRRADTRAIPVIVFSALEEGRRAQRLGAAQFVLKPARLEDIQLAIYQTDRLWSQPLRRILVAEEDHQRRQQVVDLLCSENLEMVQVDCLDALSAALETPHFDAIVVGLSHSPLAAHQLAQEFETRFRSPIVSPLIMYGVSAANSGELNGILHWAAAIIADGPELEERLLYEVDLRLHRSQASMSEHQRRLLAGVESLGSEFHGCTVLVIDDDVRNIFAITSALEQFGVTVVYAQNGKDGLVLLESTPAVKAVFTDIMMPEMDGYEVIRRIRSQAKFVELPVIAITAKAMRGDRDECIRAGATDYIAKPVDMGQLVSALRVWMSGNDMKGA
jgi:CheY-like chemotaxis protein